MPKFTQIKEFLAKMNCKHKFHGFASTIINNCRNIAIILEKSGFAENVGEGYFSSRTRVSVTESFTSTRMSPSTAA